jgi:hypothetical protein
MHRFERCHIQNYGSAHAFLSCRSEFILILMAARAISRIIIESRIHRFGDTNWNFNPALFFIL